jgi:hypothetical protein
LRSSAAFPGDTVTSESVYRRATTRESTTASPLGVTTGQRNIPDERPHFAYEGGVQGLPPEFSSFGAFAPVPSGILFYSTASAANERRCDNLVCSASPEFERAIPAVVATASAFPSPWAFSFAQNPRRIQKANSSWLPKLRIFGVRPELQDQYNLSLVTDRNKHSVFVFLQVEHNAIIFIRLCSRRGSRRSGSARCERAI